VRMSVLEIATGDLFVVRLIKYMTTNPDNKWTNSYEFKSTGAGDTADLLTLASALVLFEQTLYHTGIKFDRAIVSTWEEDSKPYDPTAFLVVPLTATGTVSAATSGEGLDKCLSVVRQPASGRVGHVFLRGVLLESDVTAPAGKTILSDGAAMQTNLESAIEAGELENYFGPSGGGPLRMVMVSKTGDQVRDILNLVVGGVADLPTDHAWFNRTPLVPS